MYESPRRTQVGPGHGPLNKVILAEDPDVTVSACGRKIIAPGLEKCDKSLINAEKMTVSENLPIPA
jgi:hypothetical protein